MIRQKLSLKYLIPFAIEDFKTTFLDAELYKGDLHERILKIETSFWDNNENHYKQLYKLTKERQKEITDMNIAVTNFDNSKFTKNKGCH